MWCTASPEVVARPGLERQREREDKNEGTPGCLWEGDDRDVTHRGASMENHHPIIERRHWSVLSSKETMY